MPGLFHGLEMDDRQTIKALLQLVDDPDIEVYDTVSQRLLGFGKDIIPSLEFIRETNHDEVVQHRIETLIHRLQFHDLVTDFTLWADTKDPDIFHGALLVARYHFPLLDVGNMRTQFEILRRNIWLELNNYLSPLEKINVVNSIIYNFYKIEGAELAVRNPAHFCVNNVFDAKIGNTYAIGALYLALCKVLDLPVFAVDLPRQFILAYVDTLFNFFQPNTEGISQIQFYIDPIGGMAYTQQDIDQYLKKIKADDKFKNINTISARRVIYNMLDEMSICYNFHNKYTEADEIKQLMKIVYQQ